ncbi:TPA: hypothetical protein SLZ51_003277 [Vibrio cholerae]|nr:hypothetical protein [Vibrio cholerae]
MSSFFCVSLDFEKKWGLLDRNIPEYDSSIRKVEEIVPRLLDIFEENRIHCTWAFVGALLVRTSSDLTRLLELSNYLTYDNKDLIPSSYFKDSCLDLQLYSGFYELKKIQNTEGQELASHTLFHTYFNEEGLPSTVLAKESMLFDSYVFSILGIKCSGIIFPRNQIPQDLSQMPYSYYRSNLNNIFDRGYSECELNLLNRSLRLIDSWIPLRKYRGCKPSIDCENKLAIPATRFFRSHNRFNFLNSLHVNRIKREMTWAAKNGDFYHLWWHPHNFGGDIELSFRNLELIVGHYHFLKDKYGMKSVNMSEVYKDFVGNK